MAVAGNAPAAQSLGADVVDRAELPIINKPPDTLGAGSETQIVPDLKLTIRAPARRNHFGTFGPVQGQRFFAQHMLSGSKRV